MRLTTIIKELQKINDEYGDMQVYAFGKKIGVPTVYRRGKDELFAEFSLE